MIVAGIDPGLAGAIAILDEREILHLDDLPVHKVPSGKVMKAELDLATLRQVLTSFTIEHVLLEKVAARPGQGVTSMFRFGHNAGSILGLVIGLYLPVTLVTPQRWQKLAGVGPSPDAARQRASQLYPSAASSLTRKKDAGRADALLIVHSFLDHRIVEPPRAPLHVVSATG